MAEHTYNLVLTRSDGKAVCVAEMTQAQVVETPGFLEDAVGKMRRTLSDMPTSSKGVGFYEPSLIDWADDKVVKAQGPRIGPHSG